jgi:hypothetical protein
MDLKTLIHEYQHDPVSTYQKLRYHVRENHRTLLRRLVEAKGDIELSAIRARDIKAWHMEWSDNGKKLSIAHAFIAQLRTISGFGLTMLEEPECERLSLILHKLRFPHPQPRTERLTAAQAIAIRAKAHEMGLPSIALAQAFQFEGMFRQKDIIGELVPFSEPGESEIRHNGLKWLRGLRWSEIDPNLILRHVTSKRQKEIELDLKLAPMVMEELELLSCRSECGPIILREKTGLPWPAAEFRRKWRAVANAAGVPKSVKNMDSRAGAITEATEAGADIEHVKHAATHSDISMTQRYSRGATDKIAGVQAKRTEHRNKARA